MAKAPNLRLLCADSPEGREIFRLRKALSELTAPDEAAEPVCMWCGKPYQEHGFDSPGRAVPKMPCLGLREHFMTKESALARHGLKP